MCVERERDSLIARCDICLSTKSDQFLCSGDGPLAMAHPLCLERQAITAEHGEVAIPVIPEVSLESDSESDVSEDSEVFSGRWGSCAISIGVSLYSGLLWRREAFIRRADTRSVWFAFDHLLPTSVPQIFGV